MLDRYSKNENFKKWADYNKFISKLTGDPIIYNLYLEDNRLYKVIFLGGHLLGYKLFISIFSLYGQAFFIQPFDPDQIHEDDYKQEILNILCDVEAVSVNERPHRYHKNAQPDITYSHGPRYKYIFNKNN